MSTTFIKAGRELTEPLEMGEAISRAVHKRPSSDVSWSLDAADKATKNMPWDTQEEAVAAVTHEIVATQALVEKLRAGELRSYVIDPATDACMKIGRHYWREHELGSEFRVQSVPDFTGWSPAMEGQPILVAAEDLPAWAAVAAAVATASSVKKPPLKPLARTTRAMKEVAEFLQAAATNPHYRDLAGDDLFEKYQGWAGKGGRHKALTRSRFYELRAEWRASR